jgi:hypothetical protein
LEDSSHAVEAKYATGVGVAETDAKLSAVTTAKVTQSYELNHDRNLEFATRPLD